MLRLGLRGARCLAVPSLPRVPAGNQGMGLSRCAVTDGVREMSMNRFFTGIFPSRNNYRAASEYKILEAV